MSEREASYSANTYTGNNSIAETNTAFGIVGKGEGRPLSRDRRILHLFDGALAASAFAFTLYAHPGIQENRSVYSRETPAVVVPADEQSHPVTRQDMVIHDIVKNQSQREEIKPYVKLFHERRAQETNYEKNGPEQTAAKLMEDVFGWRFSSVQFQLDEQFMLNGVPYVVKVLPSVNSVDDDPHVVVGDLMGCFFYNDKIYTAHSTMGDTLTKVPLQNPQMGYLLTFCTLGS